MAISITKLKDEIEYLIAHVAGWLSDIGELTELKSEHQKLFHSAKLNEADMKLMEVVAQYLGCMALALKLYFLKNKDSDMREALFTPDFEKITLTCIWERVKYLRPELDDEAGIALLTTLLGKVEDKKKRHVTKVQEPETEYRTRAKAGDDVLSLPSVLATITLHGLENGVALLPDGNAHLEPIKKFMADKLQFEDGILYFENDSGQREEFTEAHLRLGTTNGEGIEQINLPLLRFYYSAILKRFSEKVKEIQRKGGNVDREINNHLLVMPVTFYLPELMDQLGGGHFDKEKANTLISQTVSFRHIIGVIYDYRGRASYYPVLVFMGYDATKNTITFASPYLGYLIRTVYEDSIKRNKSGGVICNKRGTPALKPNHSYLVSAAIASERNRDATITAMNIVTLIEQAGGQEAHISAVELVRRNPSFEKRLRKSKKPNQLLSRHFIKAMEILKGHTRLFEVYKNLELPNLELGGKLCAITTANLDEYVLIFKHKGKNRKNEQEEPEEKEQNTKKSVLISKH